MIVEGVIRVGVFIGYILLISLLPDLRRVFQYHGAEHKAINALEGGAELTPANVQKFSLIHPRCGTAFLLWVMVIAIFVFAFVGRPVWYWLIASRILLLPVIAGLAYELIRYAGKHQDNRVLMTLLAPGLWLQRLTTREPSDDQVEVSIQALQRVMEKEAAETPDAAQARVARRGHGLDAPDRPRGGDRLGRNDGAGIRRREGAEHRVVRAFVDHRVARRHRRGQDEPRRASRGGARDVLRHVAGERARASGSSTRADARPLHHHDGRGRRLRASDRRLAHLRLGSRTGGGRRHVRGCRGGCRRGLPVLGADPGERYRHRRRDTRGGNVMADRTAHVTWSGSLMEGAGTITSVGSGAFGPLDVTWGSRAEESDGLTSPEELIAAAHAACFSMALSHGLAQDGTPPERLDVDATVTFVPGHGHHEDRARGQRGRSRARRGRRSSQRPRARRRLPGLEGARRRARDHARREPGA